MERFELMERGGVDPAAGLRVREGTIADYESLAGLHYRAGRPATVVRVLVAEGDMTTWPQRYMATSGPALCGDVAMWRCSHVAAVLIVSMPTLNGRWRELAGWVAAGDRRERAVRLNEQVRTISRVIVEPRWRGLGVATRLVREYLRSPLSPKTEAIAAMGVCCPFFASAGMRAWTLDPDRRGVRLLNALRAEGKQAWELVGARRVCPTLERELRLWANASRATRRFVDAPVGELCRVAAMGLSGTMAYTWEAKR